MSWRAPWLGSRIRRRTGALPQSPPVEHRHLDADGREYRSPGHEARHHYSAVERVARDAG